MSDEIRVTDNPAASRYEVFLGDKLAGFAIYELRPPRITFIHTEIDDAFEGHGLGSRLAHDALTDAYGRGLEVVARCPFIRRYIAEHPEFQRT
jgi:predicted GNAT family acetyltransferase